jgi:NADPH-dependent ferric siderophore reductase
VLRVNRITPHMQRITLEGAGLRDFSIEDPAQWVKVILAPDSDGRSPNRAYTVRRFDPSQGVMEIDFALHRDGGPLSRWAAAATIGDMVEIAGPRAGHRVNPAVASYLLVGDPTSLPAIGAILEALPASITAQVFIEVANSEEEQPLVSAARLELCWLHSHTEAPGTTGQLELTIQSSALDLENCQVFLAGESLMVRAVRTYLLAERALDPSRVDSKGYWKFGAADHRD